MVKKSCSCCGGEDMDPGFVVEVQGRHTQWIEGRMKTGLVGLPKLSGKKRWPIEAYRCVKCSHLEFYVADPPEANFDGTIP